MSYWKLCALITILYANVRVHGEGGVIYTRWGRTVCPLGADKVYQGFMAGPHFSKGGGGSNFLCMTDTPTPSSESISGSQPFVSKIYGAEYQPANHIEQNRRPFSFSNNYGMELGNDNAPCVVCYRPDRNAKFMIPGRSNCTFGSYTREYDGFLVAEYWERATRSEYICLDEAPEATVGGKADENQCLIYPVEIVTGSLPNPPYVSGNKVRCAVCTV